MAADTNGLTPKQRRFVEEYLIDRNATQAAIRAGYSVKTANQQGPRLLVNVGIAAAIAAGCAKVAEKLGITVERIQEELAKIGFANSDDYLTGDPSEPSIALPLGDRDKMAAVAEVTVESFKDGKGEGARDVRRVKYKLHDKRAALVDLGRNLGMFKERVEHTGKDGGPVEMGFSEAARAIAFIFAAAQNAPKET